MIEFYLLDRWIMRNSPDSDVAKIVGRVFGGEGYMHYQIAARPYDELAVGPFQDEYAALEACEKELRKRAA
jgi:hypothetical protein